MIETQVDRLLDVDVAMVELDCFFDSEVDNCLVG